MSLEEQMMRDLQRFHALQLHNDPRFADAVARIQGWQTRRLRTSHAGLLANPQLQLATEFFIGDMYGGADLTQMAHEIERALRKAMALLPESVMHTAAVAMEANAITLELDEALARTWLDRYGARPLDTETWLNLYVEVGERQLRERQLALLQDLGLGLDRYVRSKLIQGTFRLVRKPAVAAGFGTLYDFLDRGFTAMKPIPSTEEFVASIVEPEKHYLEAMFAGRNPFTELALERG